MEAARLWASGDLWMEEASDTPAETLSDAAAAFGLVINDSSTLADDEFWLWPENEPIWRLWLFLQTQWHTDQGVRTGLNYAGVEVCMRHRPIPKAEKSDWFVIVQGMEMAALAAYAEKR